MLASLLNCSNRFRGRKVNTLYLDVLMALFFSRVDKSKVKKGCTAVNLKTVHVNKR